MALPKKVYGVRKAISAPILAVHGVFACYTKSRKPVALQSEIGHLAAFQLKLQFVSDKGDKFRIRGFSLGIAYSIAENGWISEKKALQ